MTDKPRRDPLRATSAKIRDPGFGLEQAAKSVVTVQASIPEDAYTAETLGEQRAGSGVVIGDGGLILTIGYLVTEAESIWIGRSDGRVAAGHVLGIDSETGFGLIQALDRLELPALPLGQSGAANVGDPVIVAAGAGTTAVHASIAAKQSFAGYWEYYLDEAIFTAPAHPFWGGAAVIDSKGRLLGIGSLHVEQTTPIEGSKEVNMIVPIDLLPPVLDDLLAYGQVNRPARPWLGLYSAESEGRVVVAAVANRSPAAAAGLRRGDVVAGVAGQAIADLADFYRKVWGRGPAGVEVPVDIVRDRRTIAVTIRSADRASYLKRPGLQ